MSNIKIIDDTYLKDIASTIRSISNTSNNFKPSEMAPNILNTDFGILFNSPYGGIMTNDGLSLVNKYQSNTQVFYPIIGYGVTNCWRTYFNCRNAIGDPIMKSNLVDSLGETFRDCWNLTGRPQCGTNVKNLMYAYYNCQKLDGKLNQYDETYNNVTLAGYAFGNDINLRGNATYMPNATNQIQTFWNCQNVGGIGYIAANVVNAYQCYENCYNLQSANILGGAAATIQNAYRNCYNVKEVTFGDINAFTNMDNAFANCYNMTGFPKVSSNITALGLVNAYYECQNITGAPVFSPLATSGQNMYYNCTNITGMMLDGTYDKLAVLTDMFHNCRNMHGSLFLSTAATCIINAFENCSNLGGIYLTQTNAALLKAVNMTNAFKREPGSSRLNVVFQGSGPYGVALVNTVTGCNMSDSQINNGMVVQLPYCYNNGKIYGYNNIVCNRVSYNEEYNLYIYSVT